METLEVKIATTVAKLEARVGSFDKRIDDIHSQINRLEDKFPQL